jgi:hypothetical protein
MVRIERLIIVLLGGALLQARWKLYRGKVKRWWKRTKDRMPRHWQPKSPTDCPRCQGGEEIEEVVLPVETRPYAERKSQRGRKKQLDTHGWACPNEGCDLFGETDGQRHALVGHGKIGHDKSIQRLKCEVCETTFSSRKGTPLYYTKPILPKSQMPCGG